MSTLYVDELFPGIVFSQPIRVNRDVNVAHVRPWIYKHGTLQDGQLQCEIKQGVSTLATQTLDFSVINAAFSEPYAHGFIRIDFQSLALRVAEGNTEEEYTIEYSMINHTKDQGNFIGIVRRWEDKTYPTYGDGVVGGEAPNDSVEPSGLELFEYKRF